MNLSDKLKTQHLVTGTPCKPYTAPEKETNPP